MKNVPFIEVNVDDDFDTRLMLQKKAGALTVPILEKDDQFVVGYNPAKILQLIA